MSDNLTPDSIGQITRSFRGEVAIYWKNIGIFLDVPSKILNLIDQDNQDSTQKQYKMLDFWLNNCQQSTRTWTTLIRAVASDIGGKNRVLAKTIKEERLDAYSVPTEKR